MSASTEALLEQITATKEEINAAIVAGNDPLQLQQKLVELHKKLDGANQALNEARQILKD
jgi:hypothetical protein